MNRFFLLAVFFTLSGNIIAQSLEDGMIGHWKLDNNAIDESINNNNGSILNAVAVPNRLGHPQSALYFNDNGYVDFGNVLNLGLSDFSISGWFKTDANAFIKGEMVMVSKIDYQSENKYAVGIFNYRLAVVLGNWIIYPPNSEEVILKNNQWYHFAATIDRDDLLHLYLNGELIWQEDITSKMEIELTGEVPLRIGEYSGHRRYFHGTLDEIRMYDRVLSSVEVSLLYNEQEDYSCTPFRCDESGKIVIGEGVGSSDYLVSVPGIVRSDSIHITKVNNWPDYVLDKDYDLISLEELENYIKANNHLPDIPSAKLVENEGYELQKMDKLLLKKIEELTLHIIDNNQKLNSLK